MLSNIIIKNFRSNIKNYYLVFWGQSLSIEMMFALLSLRECIVQGINDLMVQYILNAQFMIACVVMVIIAVMLMIFSVRYYIKSRIRDYATFITLGIRKCLFYQIVAAEYFIGGFCSILCGLLLGWGINRGTQRIFGRLDKTFQYNFQISKEMYGIVVLLSISISLFSFVTLLVNLQRQDLSSLLMSGNRQEVRPKSRKWSVVLIGAIFLYGYGCYDLVNMDSEVRLIKAIIEWIIAGIMMLGVGSGLILEGMKKNQNIYYKHILQINQYYHKFVNNASFMIMIFVVHFLLIGYMACSIAEELPLREDRERYPYDYVWFGRETDEEIMREIVADESGELTTFPMIRMTLYSSTEHIGISESTYKKITGKTLNLKDNEMYYIVESSMDKQEEREDKEEHNFEFRGIHTGKYKESLEIESFRKEFEEEYNVYQIRDSVKREMWGKISEDDWHENTLVLSDKRFMKERDGIINKSDEANELFLINMPERSRKGFGKTLNDYVSRHGVETFGHRGFDQRLLYDLDQILDARLKKSLLNISGQLFIMISFCVMGCFCVFMKLSSELPLYREKYEFLACMGMRNKEQRKCIKRELRSFLTVPLIMGGFFGGTYMACDVWCLNMSEANQDSFIKYWCVIFALYLIIQIVSQNIIVQILAAKTIRRRGHESIRGKKTSP